MLLFYTHAVWKRKQNQTISALLTILWIVLTPSPVCKWILFGKNWYWSFLGGLYHCVVTIRLLKRFISASVSWRCWRANDILTQSKIPFDEHCFPLLGSWKQVYLNCVSLQLFQILSITFIGSCPLGLPAGSEGVWWRLRRKGRVYCLVDVLVQCILCVLLTGWCLFSRAHLITKKVSWRN